VRRGDVELEIALRRFDRLIAAGGQEYADQPLDSHVAAICADARAWIARLDAAHDVRTLRQAHDFLRRASVGAQGRLSGLSPHALDVLAGCLQGVESAVLRAERRITTRRRGVPTQYLGVRRRLGQLLRVPGYR
jgi:hypothetical protein